MMIDSKVLSFVIKGMPSWARCELDLGFLLIILVVLLHSASELAVAFDDFLVKQVLEDPFEDFIVGMKFN